ncbi:MAG: heparinase II/III family protein [Alphaproteobacteria bacterium]|nr:heparinase II/III family protein [Alphaproteobacteria bacterium]
MATEAARLHRSLAAGPPGVGRVRAAAGLLAAAAVLEGGDRWRARALAALDSALDAQVLPDGGHASRAPGTLLDALAACVEARVALSAAHAAAPPFLAEVITRMGHALRMFLAPDRGLALFHGTGEGAPAHTAAVLAAAGAGPGTRAPSSLPLMGYERATLGRASLLLDVGGTPPPEHADRAHAAPLALAFSYGPERVFTACGAHPLPGPWRDALTATAAHCALTLGHRDSAPYAPPAATREEGAGAVILEAAHEGYVPAFGVVHRRRLYLAGRGCDLRGQEMLTAAAGAGPAQPLPVAVRFHLHPRVSVALIQGGTQALLRVPGGAGWRFTCGGAALGLDNSVYLGTGTAPRKTKQIVLTAALDTKTARIRWALQREVG